MKSLPLLTICIPTYNRIEKAINVAQAFLNQKNDDFEIKIYDNASDGGGELKSFCEKNGIEYIRRIVNIGPGANIMRLFEESFSQWLIIFSDDDFPGISFVDEILKLLKNKSNNNTIAFKSKTKINSNQLDESIDNLYEFSFYNSDSRNFGSTLLISSWIFNRKVLIDGIRFSYLYFGFQAPHVIIVMYSLFQRKGVVKYLSSELLEHRSADANDSWSSGLTYTLMLSTLPAIHFLGKKEIKYLSMGIAGKSSKNVLGNLLRLKIHNNGNAFSQISITTSRSTLRNLLLVYIFKFINFLIPKKIKDIYFDEIIDRDNVKRM
jgi:glycosyltransferase involved in cell wall biosynthesis